MSDSPGSREGRYAARAARAQGSPDEFFPEAGVDVPAPPMGGGTATTPQVKQETSTADAAEGVDPTPKKEPPMPPGAVLTKHEALLKQLEETKAELALLAFPPTAAPTQPTAPQTAAAAPTDTAGLVAVSVGTAAAGRVV